VDLRGFGRSGKADAPMAIGLLAEDLISLVSDLQLAPVVVVGHSMGGYVALKALSLKPSHFSGLVLLNSRAEADGPESRMARMETAREVRANGGEGFRRGFLDKLLSDASTKSRPNLSTELSEMMTETPDYIIARALEAMAERDDFLPFLPHIAVPTLVVAGGEDKVIPLASARELARGIGGARLAIIPRAGHMANMENSQAFDSELRDFLQSL
jgi:3-oxoadipate enol-lactonase